MPLVSSDHGWRFAVVVRDVDVPAVREQQIDHLPISGPEGSLEQLAALPCRHRIYTHINNTNPMLVEYSPECAAVRRAGLTIGVDGLEINV